METNLVQSLNGTQALVAGFTAFIAVLMAGIVLLSVILSRIAARDFTRACAEAKLESRIAHITAIPLTDPVFEIDLTDLELVEAA